MVFDFNFLNKDKNLTNIFKLLKLN